MKRFLGLWVLVVVLLCGTAMAADWQGKYDRADADRLGIIVPEGLKVTEKYADGYVDVMVRMTEMSRENWKYVMIHGGYPYVRVRPYVKAPAGYDTCIAFNGSIFDVSENDIFNVFVRDLKRDGIWDNNHSTHSNGESVGEIIADQCMLIPQSSTGDGGGGYFIAWMDKDKYAAVYPQSTYPNGHQFTLAELKENKDQIFYYEYVELSVRVDTQEPFYVPFRSLSKAAMAPTEKTKMPDGVSVKEIANGDITYEFSSLAQTVEAPLVLNAPEGAAILKLFDPDMGDPDDEHNFHQVSDDGTVTCYRQIHADSYTDEYQHVAVWYDADGNIVDYGIFWTHSERIGYKPEPCYVKNVQIELSNGSTKTVTWTAPESSRVKIENNCAALGVEATYTQATGTYHISYDEDTEVDGDIGAIRLSVKAPNGAAYARYNGGGGNNIMGPDDSLAQDSHNIITQQSYAMEQAVDNDGYIELFNHEPLRHYAAGPVDVYIQSEAVWPYGGGHHVIYWYASKDAADKNPENPLQIEYVVNTADTICVTSRTEIVQDESAITDRPVDKVTCVSPDHYGKDWHLVIRRYPQKGQNACHWELYLENECGDYEPLEKDTVFYMPYPRDHKYDKDRKCAVDSAGNEATYEIYHYSSEYEQCDAVKAEPTECGIRFVVASLSPFVLDWGDFQGDLTPEQGNDGNDGNQGDHGGAPEVNAEWPLGRLNLWDGTSVVKGVRVKDLNVSTMGKTTIDKCTIENLMIEFNKDRTQGLRVDRSNIGMLFVAINRNTPTVLQTPAAVIGESNDLGMLSVVIPHPNEENSEENEWPGEITGQLVQFEGTRKIQLMIVEENWKAFDPVWFGSNVTIVEVDWSDNPAGQPVPYEKFLEELNRN